MSHTISGYNAGNYKNYQEAFESGATCKSPSDIDAVSSRQGFMDVTDMISLFRSMPGCDDFVFGVVQGDHFIEIDDIENILNEDGNLEPDSVIDDIHAKLVAEDKDNQFEKAARDLLGQEEYDKIISKKGSTQVTLIHSIGRAMINDSSLAERMPDEVQTIKDKLSTIHESGYSNSM